MNIINQIFLFFAVDKVKIMKKYKTYKIITFGCQMNLADSGSLSALMNASGFTAVETEEEADIIVINTCSVRQKAEERVFGRLGELSRFKKENNNKKIAVVGCMAQRMAEQILKRAPYVDMILGTDQMYGLPSLIDSQSPVPQVRTEIGFEDTGDLTPVRDSKYSGFVTIMRGCNNFCSYCIVPYVRGRERSYSVSKIINQVNEFIKDGVKEITLLGQNVNSYVDGKHRFPDLLERLAKDTDIQRIRFMTSHPKDLSDRLIEVMASELKIMPHIHLPLQSGSDSILERMGRIYSCLHYFELTEKLRKFIQNISITTDLIVGFPSETEKDFEKTIKAVKTIKFESAFMLRYSVRAGTAAAGFIDDVPEEEKIRRLNILIETQKKVSFEKNQSEIGKVQSVLVDGYSKRGKEYLKGKTGGAKTILFPGTADIIGEECYVKVTSADSWTLHGKLVE